VQLTGVARQGICQRKAFEAFGTIGRSGGPFVLGSRGADGLHGADGSRTALRAPIPPRRLCRRDQLALVDPSSARYTDARPILSAVAIADGRMPSHLLDPGGIDTRPPPLVDAARFRVRKMAVVFSN
jgi:hypothetical protein